MCVSITWPTGDVFDPRQIRPDVPVCRDDGDVCLCIGCIDDLVNLLPLGSHSLGPQYETLPGAAELPWAVGGCRAHRGSGLGRRSRTRVRATPAAVRTTEGDSGAPAWPDSSCTPVRLPVVLGDP